jgi:ribosomal protein S18 acetylase RimI-like enzyme
MAHLEQISQANAMTFKAIRLAAILDSPSAFGSTYAKESLLSDADWVKRAADWSSHRSIGYLAMEEGRACGIAAAFLNEHDPTKAHVISMWIAPSHRRHGIGGLLIEAINAWAESRGAQRLELMVTSNNIAALDFYQRIGFSKTGNTEPYPNDSNLFEYEMHRPITKPDRISKLHDSLNRVTKEHAKTLRRLAE